MINRKLGVKDVEDVVCTVDDMDAMDSLRSLVCRGWCEGGGGGWNEDLGFELMGETCIQAAVQGCGGTR